MFAASTQARPWRQRIARARNIRTVETFRIPRSILWDIVARRQASEMLHRATSNMTTVGKVSARDPQTVRYINIHVVIGELHTRENSYAKIPRNARRRLRVNVRGIYVFVCRGSRSHMGNNSSLTFMWKRAPGVSGLRAFESLERLGNLEYP